MAARLTLRSFKHKKTQSLMLLVHNQRQFTLSKIDDKWWGTTNVKPKWVIWLNWAIVGHYTDKSFIFYIFLWLFIFIYFVLTHYGSNESNDSFGFFCAPSLKIRVLILLFGYGPCLLCTLFENTCSDLLFRYGPAWMILVLKASSVIRMEQRWISPTGVVGNQTIMVVMRIVYISAVITKWTMFSASLKWALFVRSKM